MADDEVINIAMDLPWGFSLCRDFLAVFKNDLKFSANTPNEKFKDEYL